MYVIISSANRQDTDVMLLCNSSEVGPQARLQLLCDYFAAVLGTENHVHVNVGEGVRQCIALCAFGMRRSAYQRLTGLNAIAPMLSQGSHHPSMHKGGACWGPRFRPGLISVAPDGASEDSAKSRYARIRQPAVQYSFPGLPPPQYARLLVAPEFSRSRGAY